MFRIITFSLNQWALDFEGNTKRILDSIEKATRANAAYRCGPELEITGYSLEDAFYEQDNIDHAWACVTKIATSTSNLEMVIDVGMPVWNMALYNCRVILYRGKILAIRAKTSLAKEGNYREYRHFIAWPKGRGLEPFRLHPTTASYLNQQYVPFGADFIMEIDGLCNGQTIKLGWEICQELWDLNGVSSEMYQNFGCHIVVNGSASYWELRKLNTVQDLIKSASLKGGACYVYSNLVGCDGQRYVFYGRSCIYDRGSLVAMSPADSKIFTEIQPVIYDVDPRAINEHRSQWGINPQCDTGTNLVFTVGASFDGSQIDSRHRRLHLVMKQTSVIEPLTLVEVPKFDLKFEDEINLYVPLWLYDYLRRSRMSGFIVPLSGGLDSCTVLTLVYSLANHLNVNKDESQINLFLRETLKINQSVISIEKICHKLIKCVYLSTRYSGKDTLSRAERLAQSTGAEYSVISLQSTYDGLRKSLNPNAVSDDDVTLLDQNLQARLRMIATYYLSGGGRIVLASGNVDEGIMGYLTKYDCSSADINPIGGLCKSDLKSYLKYCKSTLYKDNGMLCRVLHDIIEAPPSAELTGSEQRDEDDIGITYDEISILGRVRRGIYGCCGPKGAFELIWRHRFDREFCDKIRCLKSGPEKAAMSDGQLASSIAELVKRFYQRYANNRHKLTVLTPALHAETYSPDDNRFDHRHFLYAPWTMQFREIDNRVRSILDVSNKKPII